MEPYHSLKKLKQLKSSSVNLSSYLICYGFIQWLIEQDQVPLITLNKYDSTCSAMPKNNNTWILPQFPHDNFLTLSLSGNIIDSFERSSVDLNEQW